MKLDEKDLEALARSRARRTKRSKWMWRAAGAVIISWLVAVITINLVGLIVYDCWVCTNPATIICNVVSFGTFVVLVIVASALDDVERRKQLEKLKEEHSK